MAVGDFFEDMHAKPLPEFDNPFLMAGGAEVAALTREGQQVFVAAVFTFDAGKTIVQIAAIEITIDHFLI